MNKTEFIQLIQTPELPSAKHVAALKQVVADFPYFTVSQVLLAKALFNEKHYEYEKYLKQTALAVPDREVLYNYLHNIKPVKQAVRIVEEPVKQAAIPALPVEPVVVEKSKEPVPVEETQTPEPVIDVVPVAAFVEEPTDHKIEEPVEATLPVLEEPKPVEEAISVNVETLDEIPGPQPQNPPITEQKTPGPLTKSQDPQPEAHSFMEWLQLAGKQIPVKPKEAAAGPNTNTGHKEPVYVKEERETPVVRVPEVTKEDIEEAVAKSNINDFGNILDRFIKENPSISRPKAEFFNPMNMARQSVEEDEELVTETLANLLYKQGNLKKAIRAYEKLCLLYPSKMTYFATLIQKIKTELKD
ncbi:MAG: hypothetical protein V4658_03170 [Bacteroidota bacterium]